MKTGTEILAAIERHGTVDSRAIKRSTEDIDRFAFNTYVAGLMEYVFVVYPRLYRLNVKATEHQFEQAIQRVQPQLSGGTRTRESE